MQNTLRVIVFHEGESWIAQCLEHDICVQAPDLGTLRRRLDMTLHLERENIHLVEPAPEHYLKLWLETENSISGGDGGTSDTSSYDMKIAA